MEILFYNKLQKSSFPYANYTLERKKYLIDQFRRNQGYSIKNKSIIGTTSGLNLCETFFPNIYECKRKGNKSPIELWQDDAFLQRVVLNRLNHASRLSSSSLRTGIKILSSAVSNFKPTIAKFLYQEYASNGHILDYSCGFGSRMLAAMSLDMEYVGCEPNLKTYDNLQVFGRFLQSHTNGSFHVFSTGSEETVFKKNYFDFAFSSPPFFDYEIYSQDPGQSIIKYPVYEDWLIRYWQRTIANCYNSLISGGHFGVCISINQHEHMIESTRIFCAELGLKHIAEYHAPYKQLFQNNRDKYDLILIFKKL